MKLAELQTKVGEVVGVTDWILMDQGRINAFADCTGDHQYIHVDPARAATSPSGGTIAHGFLTLSLLGGWVLTVLGQVERSIVLNYGFDKVRFLMPVPSGRRVRGSFKLIESSEKRPGEYLQRFEVSVEIHAEDKPALIAEWLLLMRA